MLLALLCVALVPAQPAAADGATNDVGACVSTGQVWLVVVDQDGDVMANQCVGNPTDGEAALRAGGMAITKARGHGIICSLGGVPEQCPRTFRGQYWHYWHADAGGGWVVSALGAAARTPGASSLEGWCYNSQDEEKCTVPELSIILDGVELNPATDPVEFPTTVNEPVSAAALGSPTALLATAAAVAVGGAGWFLWRRRRPPA